MHRQLWLLGPALLALACADAPQAPPAAVAATAGLATLLPPPPTAVPAVSRDTDAQAQLAAWTRRAGSGTLLLRTERDGDLFPGPVLDTSVEIAVTGMLARSVVRQRFHNPSTTWAEGVYVFPLPDDAAVDHMRIYTETHVIEGQVQERQQARRTYARAKREGRRASLLEQERPNVFTTSVANIRPGSSVEIEIEYQQSVGLDDGEYSLRFPMVVAPRYVPGRPETELPASGTGWSPDTDAVPDASRITPPVRRPEWGRINPVALSVDLAPGFEVGGITSAYHDVEVDGDAGGYRVYLADGPVPADRDFVLRWKPAPGERPMAALFSETRGDRHYALVMVTPPHQPGHRPPPPPREVVYVIDTSGSMSGTSILQAKMALRLALERLRPSDRFNVIAFNHLARGLFPRAEDATDWHIEQALQFVHELRANGGTEILPAVKLALAGQPASGDRLRQVVFLTDGSVGNEAAIFAEIQDDLGESRLFTVGIGSAPNTHFMRKAAQAGRGSFTHIGSPDEVAEKMAALFAKLESVVLADIEIDLPGADGAEIHPARIQDLYLGEPVVVALELAAPLDRVEVSGYSGDAPWAVTLDGADAVERPGVAVLWGRRKIESLMDERVGERSVEILEEIRREIVAVALEHHLVSRFTSLVAVDVTPERPVGEGLRTHALATNLPRGWQFDSVFGVAQTATPANLQLLVGAALMAGGWLARRVRGRA